MHHFFHAKISNDIEVCRILANLTRMAKTGVHLRVVGKEPATHREGDSYEILLMERNGQ